VGTEFHPAAAIFAMVADPSLPHTKRNASSTSSWAAPAPVGCGLLLPCQPAAMVRLASALPTVRRWPASSPRALGQTAPFLCRAPAH